MLAALCDDQIAQFIDRWYTALVTRGWKTPDQAATLPEQLRAASQTIALRPLAENPLLLTMAALLHSNSKQLPDDRADLYDGLVKLLLQQRWGNKAGTEVDLIARLGVPGLTLEQIRGVLERVAFDAHGANVGHQGCAEISEHSLISALRPLLSGSRDTAAQLVEFIEERGGLLVGLGTPGDALGNARHFSFPHRTFQEFLAACRLQSREGLARTSAELYAQSFDHWREVLPLAARLAKAERGAQAANELVRGLDVEDCPHPRHDDWQRALAAGLMLQEIGKGALAADALTTRQTLVRVRHWLCAGLPLHPRDGALPAAQRAAMGRVLAALGDPRFDAAHLYLPADEHWGFVHVDADPQFRIGTRKRDAARVKAALGRAPDNEEMNEVVTPSPAFWISRYPVTVAQFRHYLHSTSQRWPAAASQRDPDNAPVRWVSWHDAMGYAGWLQQQLGSVDQPDVLIGALVRDGGWSVDLPTELEWEKAARGGLQAAVFSWGDDADSERANVDQSGVDGTSPVGCFLPNDFGLHDMLGDVWEWTASAWSPVHGAAVAAKEKVVRGGAWVDGHYFARCAFRYRDGPGSRHGNVGFRVVLRSVPVAAR
jgi:formylglycine-generating enzyme required for sulfatase activity